MEHVEERKTLNKLKSEAWDYVILQEDMYLLAKEAERQEYSFPAMRALHALIEEGGAETLLFATWVNPQPIYDGRFEDYLADQEALSEAYQEIGEEIDVPVIPAGVRAFGVIVFEVFPHKIFKVPLSEHEEVIHALPFYGPYKAFSVRVQVW